ncbi:MAG: PKD domain-containing protein [Owenweeksia sp.]|nr:PKD domain-containing protein [Owenweeksia sp.]
MGTAVAEAVSITSHTYLTAGNYRVSLIGWNACGNYDTLTINLQVCDSLLPAFTVMTNGDTVNLDANTTTGASQFYWDLGNGVDTSGINLSYSYSTTGNKVIKLTAVNACGDSVSTTKTVKICVPPVASWTYNIISTTGNGMQVQFDGSASTNANSYAWDFGDGNTLTGPVQPIHTYITQAYFTGYHFLLAMIVVIQM